MGTWVFWGLKRWQHGWYYFSIEYGCLQSPPFFFHFKRSIEEIVFELCSVYQDSQAEFLTFLAFFGAGFAQPLMPQPWITQGWIIAGFWAGISPAVSSLSWARPETQFTTLLVNSVTDRDKKASKIMGGLWKRRQEGFRRQQGSVQIRPWESHKKLLPCGREGKVQKSEEKESSHSGALACSPLLFVGCFPHSLKWTTTNYHFHFNAVFKSLCRLSCVHSERLQYICLSQAGNDNNNCLYVLH